MNDITFATLAAFPQQLEAHYNAIPAEYKHWTPESWDGIPSEHLTALEQVCHVRDVEIDGYHIRLSRTLKEDNPYLGGVDTYGLVKERAYAQADAQQMFAEFRAARAQTIAILKALTPEQTIRPAFFEDYGPSTLKSIVHYLCSHDQIHLAGLQWLLGKIEAQRIARR